MKINENFATTSMAALFGILAAFGFAPWHLFWAPLLGYFGLYTISRHPKDIFAFFFAHFAIGTPWLAYSISTFGHIHPVLAILITIAAISVFALIPTIIWQLPKRLSPIQPIQHKPFWFVFSLMTAEWIRSTLLFSGFPWLILGTSQLHGPLAFLLPIIGSYGVSWVVLTMIAVSGSIHFRPIYLTTATLLVWSNLTMSHHNWTQPIGQPVSIAALKLPQTATTTQWPEALRLYSTQSLPLLKHNDLVVWPESAVPLIMTRTPGVAQYLRQLAIGNHAALLTGTFSESDHQLYNTAVGFSKTSLYLDQKHKLVAFGEYFPIPEFIKGYLRKIGVPVSNLSENHKPPAPFMIHHNIKIMPIICYEIAFPNWVREASQQANILISLHKMTWFGGGQASTQQLELAQVRSLETGKPQLFLSVGGPIAYISKQGKIKQLLTEQQGLQAQYKIQATQNATPFVRFGNWPWMSIALLTVLL